LSVAVSNAPPLTTSFCCGKGLAIRRGGMPSLARRLLLMSMKMRSSCRPMNCTLATSWMRSRRSRMRSA
jgi:hypothetical protein